jgi:hypothetical protein
MGWGGILHFSYFQAFTKKLFFSKFSCFQSSETGELPGRPKQDARFTGTYPLLP